MAQLAGFVLERRDADGRGAPVTAEARSHVSIHRLTRDAHGAADLKHP